MRKIGVLREKTVTRVYRIRTGGFQGAEQCLDVQVTLVSAGGAKDMDLVGHARCLGVDVRFAAGGNGGNPQRFGGADNPHSDFATVGDE
ncbi:hypothetical protein D3C76_695820 [compost metagenome]